MVTTQAFADRLADAVLSKRSPLVVGLDPFIDRIPLELREQAARDHEDPRAASAAAAQSFFESVLEAVAPYACAVKPQSAFFEGFGPAGCVAWERVVQRAHELDLLVIGDIKRGDIGSTARAYADAHLTGPAACDAVTLNPYMGSDSVLPFLEVADQTSGGAFVLVRTSNPSAAELQDQTLAKGARVHEHVADLVAGWGRERVGTSGFSNVGAVVGATAPAELTALRERLPHAWFLVPGVGAQGASAQDVAPAFDARGLGAVVNSSRGILYAFGDPKTRDWRSPIEQAARDLAAQLRDVSTAQSSPPR
ncbi:MAG: orotidine 5'-phosphate decarboxylase [Planctomycetota bacterium]|nr:MAG: orotidine 5'-phosphate decarboxylase [Planctomycetota bacterium]